MRLEPLNRRIVILGFGSIGQAILPLLFKHFKLSPAQIIILSKDKTNESVAMQHHIAFHQMEVTPANYQEVLSTYVKETDFLLNLSVGISSLELIKYCKEHEVLYLDASTEPWDGHYTEPSLDLSLRTNYALREEVLQHKHAKKGPTAVLTHGANPGLVSHFLKQALWNMALDNELLIELPQSPSHWAHLAQLLDIKCIHVSERDTQVTKEIKTPGEFVNTWSVDGLMAEASQPAELSWGTHERHWPDDAHQYTFGSNCSIYLNRSGARTKVRTWSPSFGPFNGFLITHAESLSMADFLTLKNETGVSYRPTVHYAYYPCPDAALSLHELEGSEDAPNFEKRIIVDDIIDGVDELGIFLMGNKKGAYWYGSRLSIHEARQIVDFNNATSLQVAAGVLAGICWAIENPKEGIVEPEDMDYLFALNIALPYLGKVGGYYTDWDPLIERAPLFNEKLDFNDPWQFINIRVN